MLIIIGVGNSDRNDLAFCVFIALATEDTHVTLSVHLPCMLYVLSN
jgi:hypothetical protein